jgi:hypothetical protein
MSNSRPVIYFLSEDLNNQKERNEILYLSRVARVVLVSRGVARSDIPGLKQLVIAPQALWMARLIVIWTKVCYLLCQIADSASDIHFPSRNIYTGTRLIRSIINAVWRVKLIPFVNRLLPTYDWLYFLPFRVTAAFSRTRSLKSRSARFRRLFVHDSLILRIGKFSSLIALARNGRQQTVANVKSWDNPFYSQFGRGADSYLVWNPSMWKDIQVAQRLPDRPVHVWGARPFYNFWHSVASRRPAPKTPTDSIVVGYAAAFCDTIMVRHEVEVLRQIAVELQARLPNASIALRPYPILALSDYAALTELPNVRLVDIAGDLVDRYNDGRELIRFGSDEERMHYLASCDCFLSMATSFTVEAAIFGMPVVHYFHAPAPGDDSSEGTFFKRINISEHLKRYFTSELLTASNHDELIEAIRTASSTASPARAKSEDLLRRIGIPDSADGWDSPAASCLRDLVRT